MNPDATPTAGGSDTPEPARNGLVAPSYSALADVAADVAPHLVTVLGRAGIAAYHEPTSREGSRRLYVDSAERADARTVIAAAMRALGRAQDIPADPLDGLDTEAEFQALIADWHVDTIRAIRDAERDLNREDDAWRARINPPAPPPEPVWLEDEHFVPPPPPPLPRLAAPTIIAMSVLSISILLLGLGGFFGLASSLTLLLGVCGVLCAGLILVSRLRADHDEDDDGTAV
jgi:hypothetical protein